jgi:hypothetical protein
MAVAERVLTLRELNRAALARQLLLARKRLSPTAVIERLVGMQAQTPQAPYVGIWSRTTNFRRQTLERDVVAGSILRATVMRQTLHLVTRRDYGLIRAALSGTNFPWESSQSKRLAPEIRALAADGPVTKTDAIAYLQREHGLAGFPATRAFRRPGESDLSRRRGPRVAGAGPGDYGLPRPGPAVDRRHEEGVHGGER